MSREAALRAAQEHFSGGQFVDDLCRRVAFPTESSVPERQFVLLDYLKQEMVPTLERMGYACRLVDNSVASRAPFLIASRTEDKACRPYSPMVTATSCRGRPIFGVRAYRHGN